MYEIVSENVSNARNAIIKKRYDLVTIQGNRILSDLAILSEGLNRDEVLLMALLGFIVRRVGIDLQSLANVQKDTARIKSTAIEILSTDVLDTSVADAPVSTLFKNYVKYLDYYANEINSNDLSYYTREGKLNKPIFDWIMGELGKINEEVIIYGLPVKGISQELRRMSYVEKLSQTSTTIQILVESLEWYSDTVKAGVSKFEHNVNNIDHLPDRFNKLIGQTTLFVKSIKDSFKEDEMTSITDLSESELKQYLTLLPDILIAWRNLLNLYYNLQTVSIARNSEKQEEGNKDGGIDGS